MGKSQAACSVAAIVSSGGEWPGGEPAQAGSVLIFEEEDDAASVIKPRLMAAGADLRRVLIGREVDLSNGIGALVAEAKKLGGVRLVVLSPLRKMIGAAEDHGNTGVRKALAPLLQWAERDGIAILGIAHPPGDKEYKAAFAGSKAYFERARAAFSVLPDPTDRNPIVRHRRRIMVAAKANNAPDGEVMGYRIEGVTVSGIETSRVVWEPRKRGDEEGEEAPKPRGRGTRAATRRAEPAPAADSNGSVALRPADAAAWLRSALAGGPRSRVDLQRDALAAGIGRGALDQAAKAANVIESKDGARVTWTLRG